ncbi:MAG: efflux RND transporter periplasmic adaptor subunit [Gemmatimonadota bacterium]|jgi:cobalt-zinc-cadmium efflux system membrane fusion protein|nr:efflux RND transporter periplasmic adaptor subunit [Gemmatimonadota bacterium]
MTRIPLRLCAAATLLVAACSADAPARGGDAGLQPDADASGDTALLGARTVQIARFDLVPVRRMPWRDATRVPARLTLAPTATQRLGAIAEGRITRVHVLPGDVVRRGQVLVRIHSHEMMDARAKLAQARILRQQAEADLALATSQADRAERLHAARALALADLERARTMQLDAQARRDAAQAELDRARGMEEHLLGDGPLPPDYDEHDVLIRSPIDGVVVTRDAQEGVVATVGMPLVTVSRTSELWMQVHVPETAAAVARVGTQIRFTVTALGDRTFNARVVRVAPAVDTLTRTIELQAVVTSRDAALKPELFATAELGGAPGAPTWVVPASAIQALEGDTVVIAADRRGEGLKLEAVRVRTGRRTGEWVELLSGVDTTRAVVTGGAAIAKAEILKRRGG